MSPHHAGLLAGYGAGLLLWLVAGRVLPRLWPALAPPRFAHPWREFAYALIAGVGIIAVGQLYMAGLLLPRRGPAAPLLESINQLLIFAPVLLLLVIRQQPLSTAWLSARGWWLRLALGCVFALAAIVVFALVRPGSVDWHERASRLAALQNLPLLVQVFLEDVTIAVIAVRLAQGLSRAWLMPMMVAGLFAAGHIPALVAGGAGPADMTSLLLDFGLAALLIGTIQYSRDILWFFPVHFAMDMMQFERITGLPSGV